MSAHCLASMLIYLPPSAFIAYTALIEHIQYLQYYDIISEYRYSASELLINAPTMHSPRHFLPSIIVGGQRRSTWWPRTLVRGGGGEHSHAVQCSHHEMHGCSRPNAWIFPAKCMDVPGQMHGYSRPNAWIFPAKCMDIPGQMHGYSRPNAWIFPAGIIWLPECWAA